MADDLKEQLRRWGNATVARLAMNDDGYSTGDSVLAQQVDFGLASRRKKLDEHEIVGRDGRERRQYMARFASSEKLKLSILPTWAVDPMPSRNDAGRPFDREPIPVDLVPDELQWINRAMARLVRDMPIRAAILREEFCGTGTQQMKAARVERDYGGKLTVRQYRYELQRALDWMEGKRAA